MCVSVCERERERERERGGENGEQRERVERERVGVGGGERKRRRRRRRRKKYVLIDQNNAQSFLDNHNGVVQDGNNAQNVDGILAMVVCEPAQVCLDS